MGVIGSSGGGMLTTYLTAFDNRITMAAPSCWVTRHLNNVENELRADSEQVPPGFLAAGLDTADSSSRTSRGRPSSSARE